ERSKRELHLRLDTNGANDRAPFARASGVVEKGRLSHAGLTTKNERAAFSTTHRAQQLIEPRTLAGAATKHRFRDTRDTYQSAHSGSSSPMRFSCALCFGVTTDLDVAHCWSNKPPPRQLKPLVGGDRKSVV